MSRTLCSLLTAAWVGAVALALWFLQRVMSDWSAALLGAGVIWWATVLWVAWYETVVAGRPFAVEDEHQARALAWEREQRWYWPGLALVMFLPGMWIGAVSHSPLVTAAAYLLAIQVVGRINETAPPRLPPDPLRRRLNMEKFLEKMGMLAVGLLVGAGLRFVLHA